MTQKKCDTHVGNSFYQLLIRQKQLRKWPNTYAKRLQKLANRALAKRLVGETTENLAILLVVCQLSRDVIGYEDS